jgi:hypothetical protein
VRLGQIDESEVEPEGADDRLGGTQVEPSEVAVEARPLERIVIAAQRDRPSTDSLDESEELRAGLFRDHLAEQRTQESNLDSQRIAGPGGPDPARLGRDGG